MPQKKILIVDDEEEIIMSIEARLQANGYEVITAKDGQEGLERARKEFPDLIILDIMMPKMDGRKVCGLLKSDERYKNIPIIMFTARVQQNNQDTAQEIGADGYVNKPFDSEDLLVQIKGLLGEM